MKKLSRKEYLAVGVALIVAFGLLFYGNYIFSQNSSSPQKNLLTDESAAVSDALVPDGVSNADGLIIADTVVGAGAAVKSGDTISVNYTGTLADATKFDSSYDRGEPITFVAGSGQLIKGFDEGVIGMKVGGKRRLTIPPELGYGDRDVGPIPANSTIVFDVQLVKIGK